jgi:hypothetical protein
MDGSQGSQKDSFGSDSYSVRRVLEIAVLLLGLAAMGFYSINTVLWQEAQIFWFLGLTGVIFILASMIIDKGKIDFDSPIDEEPMVPISRKKLAVIFAITGALTFFVMSQTAYKVGAPMFQVVDPGFEGNVFFTATAALFENDFFFVGLFGLLFSLTYWKMKNAILSFLISGIAVIGTFTVYHLAVYGIGTVESWAVVLFGFEMVLAMVVLRSVTYVHVRHVFNNLGIFVFTKMDPMTFALYVLTNWVSWVIVGVIIVLVIIKLKRR